jgi:hypothetical protein
MAEPSTMPAPSPAQGAQGQDGEGRVARPRRRLDGLASAVLRRSVRDRGRPGALDERLDEAVEMDVHARLESVLDARDVPGRGHSREVLDAVGEGDERGPARVPEAWL